MGQGQGQGKKRQWAEPVVYSGSEGVSSGCPLHLHEQRRTNSYTFSQSPIDCLTEYDGKVSSLQSCVLLTLGTGMSLSLLSGSPTISFIRCILQNKCTAMPSASQYFDWMSVLCQLSSPPILSSIFFYHTLSNFIFIFLPDAYIEGPWAPLFLPWLRLRDVLFPCYWCWQKQGTFFSHVLLISQTECTRCFLVAKDTRWHNHT